MTGRREYRTIDKSDWGDGAWQTEPDKVSWTDQTTGLPCLIVRNHSGALCGYVGVNPGHPWHGRGYADALCGHDGCYDHRLDSRVDVHGGLTFSDGCGHGADEATGICHIPEPGQPDDVWWFGFDCAHAWDLTPGSNARIRDWHIEKYGSDTDLGKGDTYRDVGYVTDQIKSLAAQLSAAS